ncbi:hypothetical protein D0O09_02690 [Pseudomonas putida]|nr:hypothetical protein D0O09_02690 [Pseudomonas putida]
MISYADINQQACSLSEPSMHEEPFILSSIDRARDWVDICSRGAELPKEKVAALLAKLCGFGSWDIMSYAIEALPPSLVDEKVDSEIVQARFKHHMEVLSSVHLLDLRLVIFILTMANPTSGSGFKAFSKSDEIILNADQRMAFKAFLDEPRGDEPLDFDDLDFLTAPSDLDHFVLQCEPNRTHLALALCGHTEPLLWCEVFDALGWEYAFAGDDIPDIDEHSFVIYDDMLGEVPVYITPLSRAPATPGEPIDRALRLQRAACLGDFLSRDFAGEVALMLMRWPLMTEINGHIYCHAGSVYICELDEWKDLLFNVHCSSVSELLELNNLVEEIHKGHPALEDHEGNFSTLLSICLSDLSLDDFEVGQLIPIIRQQYEETGWFMQRIDEFERS